MTDPALAQSSAQAGTSANGAAADPRRDPAIFRPDGLIIIPRSDGDPTYLPPNTDVPPPTEKEVNYYHVFHPDDAKYQRWCATLGTDLADWAGQPKKPPQGKIWRIKEFPANYQFTEQRKGPSRGYRTDPYLFGSNAHRFRSTKEFLHHAQWLISDPTMDPAKCGCKYCTGSRTAIPAPGVPRRPAEERAPRPAKQPRASLPSKKVPNLNAVRIRTQQLPPANKRIELGVVVPSVPSRDADLSRAAMAGKGQSEGYRVGELVWVKLTKPVVDPTKATRIIDMWPALISEVTFTTRIAPPNTPTDPRRANTNGSALPPPPAAGGSSTGTLSLQGRVRQERVHEIVLFGSPADRGKVGEDRLRPFLSGFVNEDVKRSSFGKIEEHSWLDKEGGVPPKLFLLEPRPTTVPAVSFATVVAALAYSMTACSYMRCRYLATNSFEVPEGARVMPPPAPTISDDQQASATTGSTSAAGASVPAPGPSAAPATYPPAPYAQNGASSSSSTAPAAEGDNEIRPGLADRKNAADGDQKQSPVRRTGPVQFKPGFFYQGVQAGVERLWVGDVVRLRLREKEVKEMFESIAAEKKLERKSDANDGFDVRGSYVMRVRAFMEENRKLRAAGRVYQIMTAAQFEAKKAKEKELYDAKAERDAAGGDPFGGMGRPFAFPAMGVLTASGTELPATPQLPDDFYLSPINRDSHEVVLDMVNVAGRLWPSLAQPDDMTIVKTFNEHRVPYTQALDCEEPEWSRVSLTGGLPGFVKPLNLEARERGSRDELMKACFEISRSGVRQMIRNAIQSEGGYVPPDPPAATEDGSVPAENGQSNGGPVDGAAAASQPASAVTADASLKRKAQDSPSQSAATPAKKTTTSHINTTNGAMASPGLASTPTTASARSNSGTAASTPVTSTPAARPGASTQEASPSVAKGSNGTAPERSASPPLPPGWMKKVSRSGLGVYYANPRTKQTSWDRPTE